MLSRESTARPGCEPFAKHKSFRRYFQPPKHLAIGCKWAYHWHMLRTGTIQITQEILTLIARIDEFKGAWRALVERGALNQHGSGRGVWYDLQ